MPIQQVTISPMDHGFMYGMGLFETFRTYHGQPFLLEEHGRRLNEACLALGIEHTFQSDRVRPEIDALLQANQVADAVVRYAVSAGENPGGLPTSDYVGPNTFVYLRPLPSGEHSRKGKALQLLRTRRNTPEGTVRFKSFHYMNSILANRELAGYGWSNEAEGVQLTEQGMLAEGIVSNLFYIRKDGTCCTPSLSTGILPGVTRAYVLEMAKECQLPIEEGEYRWEDLLKAEEIFLTNSVQAITPVVTLHDPEGNRTIVGNGTPGRLTMLLQQKYNKRAEEM